MAFTFSSFLMKLFLLPTERRNKITVRKGPYLDQCIGIVSADVSVVCQRCVDQCIGWHVGQCFDRIRFFTFTRISQSCHSLWGSIMKSWYVCFFLLSLCLILSSPRVLDFTICQRDSLEWWMNLLQKYMNHVPVVLA